MSRSQLPAVEVTFSCAWWHENYGLAFGREYWLDPIRRTEQDRSMERLLYERFGDVGLGDPDPQPKPNISLCGHRFIPAVLGCEILYSVDQAPAAVTRPIDLDEMSRLQIPDLDESAIVRETLRQARLLADRYGACAGEINVGGPLNVASVMLGDAMFVACGGFPEAAHHVLDLVARTIVRVYDHVSCRVEPAVHQPSHRRLLLGDCPVVMISPEMYRDLVLPHDSWYRQRAEHFVLHHCGVMDRYLDGYKRLGPTPPDEVEVGWGSDVRAARRAFPTSKLALMLNVPDVVAMSPAEIDEVLATLVLGGAPWNLVRSIWVADVGPELSDERVRFLRTYPERLAICA